MSTNIYRYEVRVRWKSVLIWTFALASLLFIFMALFPSFSAEAAAMNEMVANFPPALKSAFGISNLDLSSVLGYFSFCRVFCQLCFAIQASNYGFGLVSVEENEMTADFLLTKPVSRSNVLRSKILAALTSLLATDVLFWLMSYASIVLFREGKPYELKILLLLLGSVVVFQLFFFFVALAISQLVRRVRSVTPYSLGLAFGAYVLNAFAGIFGDVKLEYLTPFKHFDTAAIVLDGHYNLPLVLLEVGVIILALGFTWLRYARRDIPTSV